MNLLGMQSTVCPIEDKSLIQYSLVLIVYESVSIFLSLFISLSILINCLIILSSSLSHHHPPISLYQLHFIKICIFFLTIHIEIKIICLLMGYKHVQDLSGQFDGLCFVWKLETVRIVAFNIC